MRKTKATLDWNPQEETDKAIEAAKITYQNILEVAKRDIKDDSEGSDLKNEVQTRVYCIQSLKDIIKHITSLQEMKDSGTYKDGDKEWSSQLEDEYID